jgi:fructokinase
MLETDVNAAALGEGLYAAAGCRDYAYITVGTGVGVGVVTRGRPVHGAGHPEAGHMLVRQRRDDHFAGVCFAHGGCVEGLISGPALEARLGAPASNLGRDHAYWDLSGDYLAQLCMALILTTAPQRIVLGGGVGARPEMLNAARRHLLRHLNGYIDRYQTQADIDALLVPAVLEHSGLIGALGLAQGVAVGA